MAKKKAAVKPAKQQELEKTEPEAVDAIAVSKAEAVRQAVAAGVEMPADGVAYVNTHFGIEMDNKTFSLSRSQQKARDAEHKAAAAPKAKRNRKPKVLVEGYVAPPAKKAGAGDGDLLAAMEAMKPLVASPGVEKVKRIVNLLE